jgi:hypothetical protein
MARHDSRRLIAGATKPQTVTVVFTENSRIPPVLLSSSRSGRHIITVVPSWSNPRGALHFPLAMSSLDIQG